MAKRVVLITGAAAGIGRATAHEFARRGAVLTLVDQNRTGLETLADELAGSEASVLLQVGDLADLEFAERIVDATLTHWGRCDVLVNNAAWRELVSLRRVSIESWERTLRVSLTVPAMLSRWVAEPMRRQGGGVIVNVSSIQSSRTNGLASAYVAAKGGLDALTYDMACLFGRANIRVVAVNPGAVDTLLSNDYTDEEGQSVTDELRDSSEDHIPLGRWARPEEIARVIAFVASDDAAYLTGTTITVDGGWTHSLTPHRLKRRMMPEDFPE